MKTILIPIDFSSNSENALNYAIDFAKKENAKLVLLNVFDISYASGAVPYTILAEERSNLKKESDEKLKVASLKIEFAGCTHHEAISIEGFTVDVILDVIKKKQVDLVIMGTKGATGFSGVIFGSNTAKIIEDSTCPVIAIPQDAKFEPIKKITFATNYNHNDIDGLKSLVVLAEPFNAQINVLHVTDDTDSSEVKLMKAFTDDVKNKISYNNIIFQSLPGNDVDSALQKHIDDNGTNLLVMSTHHRNLFDKIFGKSITKQMAYHINIPLMALHYNGKIN
jgi:nucleotide-binding universal stress UspA family protein